MHKSEFEKHLITDLIPFWNGMRDEENGGFYGAADAEGVIDRTAPKSAVLQTRILWFYSACYRALGGAELLENARRQFGFLIRCLIDPADGGARWTLNPDGSVKSDMKHTYAQAFTLYAMSCYYNASGDEDALHACNRLFELIERDFRDEYGYFDQFDLDHLERQGWRTMNTLLHIIEAYAEYYEAVKTPRAQAALKYSLELARDRAYNPALRRMECNFDPQMRPVGDMHSYGHDIEASWLIDRGCEALGDETVTASLGVPLRDIYECVCETGLIDEGRNGLYYDCRDGKNNTMREWWVMAEAIVAMVHQCQKNSDKKAMELAENVWKYTRDMLISPYGEWYWGRSGEGALTNSKSGLAGPWKCPYHNGRLCLEMMARL